MKADVKPKFNMEWAKKAGKKRFVENHERAYPNLDLGNIFDEMFPPKKKEDKEVK